MQLERQPERLGPAGLAPRLLPALGRAREPDAAALDPARIVLAAAEPPVELDRVHHHPRQRLRAAELADEPGGVERRAAREVRPLEQQHVVPAELGQVVGDRRAAHPAADDHAARARRQLAVNAPRACSSQVSKRGSARLARTRPRCSAAYAAEVEVELGDRRLHDAPHRPPRTRPCSRISPTAASRCGRRLAEVRGHERRLVLRRPRSWWLAKFARSKRASPMPRTPSRPDPQPLAVVGSSRSAGRCGIGTGVARRTAATRLGGLAHLGVGVAGTVPPRSSRGAGRLGRVSSNGENGTSAAAARRGSRRSARRDLGQRGRRAQLLRASPGARR